MNTDQLLQELSAKIQTGEITREDVLRTVGDTRPHTSQESARHFSVTKMLYVLGAVIATVGIIIYVYQVWDNIYSFGRILITLGLGFLFACIGSFLFLQKPQDRIGAVFHVIGGLLIPGGVMVTLNELNVDLTVVWPVTYSFGALFVFYILLCFIHKNALLTFFAISHGTAFIYLLTESILLNSGYAYSDLYEYLTMIIGVSYLLFAYAFRGSWNKVLVGPLHFFGILAILGAAYAQVFDSVFWEMFYFILLIGCYYLAVALKSRSILIISTLFLIAHVSYITGEYFADSLGWPLMLVILGFLFIGLGYVSVSINKKYIQQ